jgi:hypothetical protein
MYGHKESYKYYKKYYDNINIVLYTTQTIYVNKFYEISPKKNLDTLPFTTKIKQMDWNKNSDTFMKIVLISNDSFEIKNDKIVIVPNKRMESIEQFNKMYSLFYKLKSNLFLWLGDCPKNNNSIKNHNYSGTKCWDCEFDL